MTEHGSKEYYEKQSEYWFNEASKFVKQRDILIDDNAKLRKERDDLKRRLEEIVALEEESREECMETDEYVDKIDEIIGEYKRHLKKLDSEEDE